MSIQPPNGILDITGATLRVSKMEFSNVTGFDTVLNNVARNTVLHVDTTEYTANVAYAVKPPNMFMAQFDLELAAGGTGLPCNFNYYNDSNLGTSFNGYNLSFNDTSIILTYDGGSALHTATLSSSLNNGVYRKVKVLFDRDTTLVSINGENVFRFKDTLRPRTYDTGTTGYIRWWHNSPVARKIKNLKVSNGEKWAQEYDSAGLSSNISYTHGLVGVGTSVPEYTLDVAGDIRASGNLIVNGSNTLINTTSLAIEDGVIECGKGNSSAAKDLGFLMVRNDGSSTTNSNVAMFWDESTDALTFGFSDSGPTATTLTPNTSKVLKSYFAGRVGIGIADPDTELEVAGTLTISNGDQANAIRTDSNGNLQFLKNDASNGDVTITINDDTGNVGIGTNNPFGKLQVDIADASAATATWDATKVVFGDIANGNSQGLGFGVSTNSHASIISLAPGVAWRGLGYYSAWHKWYINDVEKMVLDSSGNLGIGTGSPATPFNINKLTATVSPKAHTTTEFIRLRGDKVIGQTYAISGGIKLGGDTGGTATADGRIEFYANDGADPGNSYGDVPDNFIMCMRGDGNVGIGTASPLQTLHVAGNGQNPVIYMADSTNTRYASGMGTHHVSNEGQRLDFYNGDSGANGTSLGSSHIRMSIKHNGNVGIGTVSPTKSLEIDGTTLRHAYEYTYQDTWTSNNNQTFTIPVSGSNSRGEMLVEAEVIQVANNSSGERMARVKGIITNYHTGNFYMTVFEGENATAFETYIVGTSLSATGTFTMKYRPQVGYQQNVVCRLNLKIFVGGVTASLGSLTRTDAGSNSALTAPTLNSAPKIFGGNVGVGTTSPVAKLHVASHGPTYTAISGNDRFRIEEVATNGNKFGLQMGIDWGSGNSTLQTYFLNSGGTYSQSYNLLLQPHGGNVGIGTVSPKNKLDVRSDNYATFGKATYNAAGWSGIRLGTPYATNHDAYCSVIESYNNHASDYNSDLRFKTSNGNNASGNERMRITSAGNVGIGTATPYAKLHVNGTGNINIAASQRQYFRYDYNNVFGGTGPSSGYGWATASIYASQSIACGDHFMSINGAVNSSDFRIKKNIVDADDAECLEVLRLLKPKKYQYKDEIKSGTEPVWGFIAQEVRETLPYATQTRQFVLPNIYELANVSSSNVITFTNFNTSNLESNATTLIRTKGIDGEDHDIHLAEVIDEHTIRVEEDLSLWTGSVDAEGNVITQIETTTLTPEEYEALEDKTGCVANISGYQNANVVISVEEYNGLEDTAGYEEIIDNYTKTVTTYPGTQLFVYGQEVDDFVFLKKEAIWTVATAALQEVDRQLQAEKTKTNTLDTELQAEKAKVADLLARVTALENA